MINIRQKSVNINTQVVIEALRANLETHTAEYEDALNDYQAAIILKLEEAIQVAKVGVVEAANVRVQFSPPPDHRKDYAEALEMLEYSTDATINLDHESFKAYIKNEWSWSGHFRASALETKMYVGGALGSSGK